MEYKSQNLKEILAGEYVLGTLRGMPRLHFEKQLARDAGLRGWVLFWEKKFSPLIEALPEEAPPERIWRRLEEKLSLKKEREPWFSRLGFWRPFGLAAAAAALILALYVGLGVPPISLPPPAFVSLIQDEHSHPVWMVKVLPSSKEVMVKVINAPTLEDGKSLELWMLPGKDQAPISLGLVPESGSRTLKLDEEKLRILRGAAGLAVSVEPAGGSPTGAPTGPVLYQGAILPLG
jgi:anti-sigma-K factor RskA